MSSKFSILHYNLHIHWTDQYTDSHKFQYSEPSVHTCTYVLSMIRMCFHGHGFGFFFFILLLNKPIVDGKVNKYNGIHFPPITISSSNFNTHLSCLENIFWYTLKNSFKKKIWSDVQFDRKRVLHFFKSLNEGLVLIDVYIVYIGLHVSCYSKKYIIDIVFIRRAVSLLIEGI